MDKTQLRSQRLRGGIVRANGQDKPGHAMSLACPTHQGKRGFAGVALATKRREDSKPELDGAGREQLASLSPQWGEGLRVRGENALNVRLWNELSRGTPRCFLTFALL